MVEVVSYDSLHDLMILKQFKNLFPELIALHDNELKVSTGAESAALAGDYVLTHAVDSFILASALPFSFEWV